MNLDKGLRRLLLVVALSLWAYASSASAAVDRWTTGGPLGGPINAIAFDTATPTTAYAGGDLGVWKSIDGGSTWTLLWASEGWRPVSALAVDPLDPSILYAGFSFSNSLTTIGAVAKSTDGGSSWSHLPAFDGVGPVVRILVDPTVPGRVHVATRNRTELFAPHLVSVGGNVFRSLDGGATRAPGVIAGDRQVNAVDRDPTASATLYAIGDDPACPPLSPSACTPAPPQKGVFKTTDGGLIWSHLATTPINFAPDAIAVVPTVPTMLYAGAPDGVWRSVDGGLTWSIVASVGPVSLVSISPSGVLFMYSRERGLLRSVDGGVTVTAADAGLATGGVIGDLAFGSPSGTQMILAAGQGSSGGVFRSADGAASWTAVNSGIVASNVTHIALDPDTPTSVVARTVDSRAFRSTNAGSTWSELTPPAGSRFSGPLAIMMGNRRVIPGGLPPTAIYAGTVRPSAPGDLFPTVGGIATSIDGGASFAARAWPVGPPPTALVVARSDHYQGQLYVGTAGSGVRLAFDDEATNWGDRGPAISSRGIGVDYVSSGTVLFQTTVGAIYKSVDRGHTWTLTFVPSSGRNESPDFGTVAVDSVDPRNVYVAARARRVHPSSDSAVLAGGIWKSTDAGITWTRLTTLSIQDASDIVLDPASPQTLYAAAPGLGVMRSVDAGASWTPFNDGLTTLEVHDLAIDPAARMLYVGTLGGGVFSRELAGADVALSVSGPSAPTEVGGTIRLRFDVRNVGPEPSGPITFQGGIPRGMILVRATPSQGTLGPVYGDHFYCSLSDLAAGATASVSVVVRASSPGTGRFSAFVGSRRWDPIPTNNKLTGIARARDTTKPRLTRIRTLRVKGHLLLRLRLSERVKLKVRIDRVRGQRQNVLRRLTPRSLPAGAARMDLGRLAPGRYILRLTATDPSGNRRVLSVGVRVIGR